MKSFKVICIISPAKWKVLAQANNVTCPQVLDECTVVEVADGKIVYYVLAEHPNHCQYAAQCFATLPPEEPAVVNEQEFEAIIYQR